MKMRGQVNCISLLAILSLLFFGCVSSSDESEEEDKSNDQEVRQAIGAVSCGQKAATIVSQLSQRISPIKPSQDRLAPAQSFEWSTIDEDGPCTVSGTNSISMIWDGPDAPDINSCNEVANLDANLTLNDCVQQDDPDKENSLTMEITKDGSLCQPDRIYQSVRNLHAIDQGSAPLNLESDALQIETTEIATSSDEKYYTHVKMSINGDARGTAGGINYAAQFDDFIQIVDTNDNRNFILEFSGNIKSDCMTNWASVETIESIKQQETGCPTEGKIKITIGDASTIVTYESDGSVSVGDQKYPSCKDVQLPCNT